MISQVFLSETQNISNQGKFRGLFIGQHGLSAQPYLKQPCNHGTINLECLMGGKAKTDGAGGLKVNK